MFDLTKEWNLSFAGCGFLGIYHIGVASCLMEQAPYLIKGATKIYGASAGALTASMLASQAPIAKCCEDVIETVKEARKRNLGPLHPSFNLVKVLRTGLQRDLPANAHTLASGRLCVSLTRVSDGQNVIVSQFKSKEDLIQALICSCFIPIYCGLIPPSFQGVRYVDGGISDNLPQSELKNTISISPFSGESDICPRDTSFNFHEFRFTNTSIQINLGNMYRLSKALFPPEPKIMAEICQNGYKDAFRFLEENHLLKLQYPTAGPSPPEVVNTCCCKPIVMETTKDWMLRRLRLLREWHWWLDEQIVDNLPAPIKKVFCEACQQKPGLYAHVSEMLPVRVASYMLLPCTLPVVSAYSVGKRFVEWIPEVPADMRWLAGIAGDVAGGVYRQTRRGGPADKTSDGSLRNCMSLPPSLDNNSLVERDSQLSGFALSALDLSSHYRNIPTGPSSQDSASPLTLCSSPRQICFFVGSQEESD
ncbi:patatin-like phospholipase domain containing 3 [Esox lucius]|uniref:triacylglycerol lipase n=1 Tax=Esox lucius TaxID=8010 RepID=A0A3P8YVR1_ESOLU|nr:patatin-like phospholipase domain containing 3 [Esox lucius]XP_019898535.2 patatin-like phospholipase domain containing 3 [Esox lucius]